MIHSAVVRALKGSLMIDMDPVLLSQRVWPWIQLTLHDKSNAELALGSASLISICGDGGAHLYRCADQSHRA